MRVLLGLGDVELARAAPATSTSASVSGDGLLREHDRAVELLAVARHRRQVDAARRAAAARAAAPRSGRKLKKIAVSPGSIRGRAVDHDRLDELVGDARVVARLHRVEHARRVVPCAAHERVERALRPLPALVAVHRVVAADDGRDPVLRQRREVVDRRVRRDVAAVGERVDPRLLGREARAARAGGRCASGRRPARRARAGARGGRARTPPRSAGFSKSEPSAIARFTRIRSW